uniref:Elongation factor Ts, mitochondrial n=1 Tax=Coccolithus braarudii TaxID=221442 RepID=A0A7S0Q9L7_9EUKA
MRARTSAPMKKCVEALNASSGDIDEAIAWLRKAGVASAHKKAARGASEGVIAMAEADGALALVEINTETDFVARNDVFRELTHAVCANALSIDTLGKNVVEPIAIDMLNGTTLPDGSLVQDSIGVAMTQLGENIVLRRATRLSLSGEGVVVGYVHNAYSPRMGRTGAAVALSSAASDVGALRELGLQLAMHVVAASPIALSKEMVDEAHIQRERDILTEQALSSGKPQNVIDKMVAGRLNKYFQEVALLEQAYVLDEQGGSVRKVLEVASTRLGAPVELAGFARYHIGEIS